MRHRLHMLASLQPRQAEVMHAAMQVTITAGKRSRGSPARRDAVGGEAHVRARAALHHTELERVVACHSQHMRRSQRPHRVCFRLLASATVQGHAHTLQMKERMQFCMSQV